MEMGLPVAGGFKECGYPAWSIRMNDDKRYDAAIIGGGLAGLALSIQLARLGYSIVLFEKEQYPFHKVCGEYISLESWDFLNDLGVDLDAMKVPIITKLEVSSANGKLIEHHLPQGGFGLSRYQLDHTLAQIAVGAGVLFLENTKVSDVHFNEGEFTIESTRPPLRAKIVCGTYGKRSNIDIKWKRPFSTAVKNKLNNYIGVKYHITGNFPTDTIALHNFKNGYCGLVKIEGDHYNLCYLTTANNLKKSDGDFKIMERRVLGQNARLQKIFEESGMVSEAPLTISQISFDKKSQVENHVLMAGDAAGMITPLCGNGMSMALHASKVACGHIQQFLQGLVTREEMEKAYCREWQRLFANRLRTGRRIQRLFGSRWLSNLFIGLIKPFPALVDSLIKKTHGNPF
jgi:menaquinone-9 beta-reductase